MEKSQKEADFALAASGEAQPQFVNDDVADNATAATDLVVGQPRNSTINQIGDLDYFRVTLEANQTYTFSMSRSASGGIADAYLELRDASDVLVASDDDAGILTDSLIMFRVPTSGTYYVVARAFENASSGGYTLSATAIETGTTTAEVYPSNKPIFSWTEAAHKLNDTGASWGSYFGQPVTITYAFRSTAPGAMPTDTGGFSRFNDAQIAAAEAAIQAWEQVANIDFVRIGTGTADAAYSNNATILFANYSTGQSGAAAFAYLPTAGNTAASSVQGDIWINSSLAYNTNPVVGEYGPHVLLHEIGHALGLSHPSDYSDNPSYANDAEYHADSRLFTVMSYFSTTSVAGGAWGTFASLPQMHDIAAIQRLYGANLSTRTGDTIYGFNATAMRPEYILASAGQIAGFTIWDAGGNDTLDLSGYSEGAFIDLREESFSSAGPGSSPSTVARLNIAIARGALIENAIGGLGNDQIGGNAYANGLRGGEGRDTMTGRGGNDELRGGEGDDQLYGDLGSDYLYGEDGHDILEGGPGDDYIDGGDGYDQVSYQGSRANDSVYRVDGMMGVLSSVTGVDRLYNVESVRWTDVIFDNLDEIPEFRALDYIASFDDLTQIYGLDVLQGFDHYLTYGFQEGRTVDGFDAFLYTAGYDDLIGAFGLNESAAAYHFIAHGFGEGRDREAFDTWSYVAGSGDLILAYGLDERSGAEHYIVYGFAEGRQKDAFDELRYIASHDDLVQAYGMNARDGLRHWIESGYAQGREAASFDPAQYIASFVDLIVALGDNLNEGVTHFIEFGFGEGRSRDSFDALQYLANYDDLSSAFGSDQHRAALHFIQHGFAEGRTDAVLTMKDSEAQFAAQRDGLERNIPRSLGGEEALIGWYGEGVEATGAKAADRAIAIGAVDVESSLTTMVSLEQSGPEQLETTGLSVEDAWALGWSTGSLGLQDWGSSL